MPPSGCLANLVRRRSWKDVRSAGASLSVFQGHGTQCLKNKNLNKCFAFKDFLLWGKYICNVYIPMLTTHTYRHTNMHAHIYTHTYTNTHAHMLSPSLSFCCVNHSLPIERLAFRHTAQSNVLLLDKLACWQQLQNGFFFFFFSLRKVRIQLSMPSVVTYPAQCNHIPFTKADTWM